MFYVTQYLTIPSVILASLFTFPVAYFLKRLVEFWVHLNVFLFVPYLGLVFVLLLIWVLMLIFSRKVLKILADPANILPASGVPPTTSKKITIWLFSTAILIIGGIIVFYLDILVEFTIMPDQERRTLSILARWIIPLVTVLLAFYPIRRNISKRSAFLFFLILFIILIFTL